MKRFLLSILAIASVSGQSITNTWLDGLDASHARPNLDAIGVFTTSNPPGWSVITGKPTFATINGQSITAGGDITIPAGATGPQGPKGDTGATGATGPAGSDAAVTNANVNAAIAGNPSATRTALNLGTVATTSASAYAAASHTHAAGDITSGTIPDARIASAATWNAALQSSVAAATYAPIIHTQAFSTITSTPTTRAGYGLTDAAPLAEYKTSLFTAEIDKTYDADGTFTVTMPSASGNTGRAITFYVRSGTTTISGGSSYTSSRYPVRLISNGTSWTETGNQILSNVTLSGAANTLPNQTAGSNSSAMNAGLTMALITETILDANASAIVTNSLTTYQTLSSLGVGMYNVEIRQKLGGSAYATEGAQATITITGGTFTVAAIDQISYGYAADIAGTGTSSTSPVSPTTVFNNSAVTVNFNRSGAGLIVDRRFKLIVSSGSTVIAAQGATSANTPSVGVTPCMGSFIRATRRSF